jgi:DNA-binding phage protein
MYREKSGQWRYPRFVKGHRPPQRDKPSQKTVTYEGVGSPEFVRAVREQLARQDKNYTWLRRETGISRTSLFRPGQKRPETAARVAHALGMNVAESVALAGWPYPSGSPILLALLDRLVNGAKRATLAEELGLHRDTLDNALNGSSGYFRPNTVHRLAQPLGLTADNVNQELTRAFFGHANAMRRGWDNLSEEDKAAYSATHFKSWMKDSERMAASTQKSAASRTLDVDGKDLERLLQEGLSYAKIGRQLAISPQVAQRRAAALGLQSVRSRHRQRTESLRHQGVVGALAMEENGRRRRAERYWPIFERYTGKGLNPKAPNVWRMIVSEAGGTHPTARKAYAEWLLSTSVKRA